MSRQPKSKRLAVNDGNKASKAPQNAKMIPVTKAADLAKYVTPAPMSPNKGQMFPEAPWKALPNITHFPDDAATGTVYTAAEAMRGNSPSQYQDPLVDNSQESVVGGFIDTGLLMRQTKEFHITFPDDKMDADPSDENNSPSRGGFPVNPQAPGMTAPLLNAGKAPMFKQRFSAEEARSTDVAGQSGGNMAAGGKKSSSGGPTITRG
jgi:hypothetical protein